MTLDSLPPRYNIITSLPDISEIGSRRRKMSPVEYEQWFINVVFLLLNRLPPDQVAIFYQTPGRNSGVGGEWLDKGLLCQLGAREAGARVSCLICLCNRDAVSGNNTPCYQCVWQKIVLDSAPGILRCVNARSMRCPSLTLRTCCYQGSNARAALVCYRPTRLAMLGTDILHDTSRIH